MLALVVVEGPPGAVCSATLEIDGDALVSDSSRIVTVLAPLTFTVEGASSIALDCVPPFAAEPPRHVLPFSASSAAVPTLRFNVARRAMLAPPPARLQTPPVPPAPPLAVITAFGAVSGVAAFVALCITLWVVLIRRAAPATERGSAVDAEDVLGVRAIEALPVRFVATAIVAPSSPVVAAIAAVAPDFPFDFAFTDNPELMSMAKELHFQLGSLETDASSALIGVQS